MVEIRLNRAPRGDGYRYFWAKGVEGFDVSKCCMPSLLGPRIKRVTLDSVGRLPFDESSPFFYVCASVGHYATNTHLALRPKAGSSFIETTTTGLVIEVDGAERVDIPEIREAERIARGLKKRQWKCRNFRFGYAYFPSDRGTLIAAS